MFLFCPVHVTISDNVFLFCKCFKQREVTSCDPLDARVLYQVYICTSLSRKLWKPRFKTYMFLLKYAIETVSLGYRSAFCKSKVKAKYFHGFC